MQKLITVSVDTSLLEINPDNPFTINEVDSVNELLEQGWEIEQLELLKGGGTGEGGILFLVILNDDAMFDDEEQEFDDEFGFDEDDEDMEDEETDQLEENKKG